MRSHLRALSGPVRRVPFRVPSRPQNRKKTLILLALIPTYGAIDGGSSVLLSNGDDRSPYGGIVRYVGRAQCTGVFVATVPEGEDARNAPAYVLTNGHCAEFPGANEVIINRPAPSTHRVIFNYFADTAARAVSVPVSRIAYATMKGQDVAVLELAARYDEIVRRGFEPWRPAFIPYAPDESIVIVGAPMMANAATSFLRLAACRLQSRADVVLEHVWHWFDFDRNRCLDIGPGSSGSPVISRQTGQVIGLVNTTTTGAVPYTECVLNHPCEPVRGDVTSRSSTTYVTPIMHIDRCFDEAGQFDLTRPPCPLDTDRQVRVVPTVIGSVNPRQTSPILGLPRQRWDVAVSGMFDHYTYKVVNAESGDCSELRGYVPTRRVSDRPIIDGPLPQTDGYHFLCVLGVTTAGRRVIWQNIDHPTVVKVRIDTIAPRIPARIGIGESDLGWTVSFGTLEPEIFAYTFKFGRPSETRCQDSVDYRLALIPFISLPKANRPYVFCAIPYDGALNPGSTFEMLLP